MALAMIMSAGAAKVKNRGGYWQRTEPARVGPVFGHDTGRPRGDVDLDVPLTP